MRVFLTENRIFEGGISITFAILSFKMETAEVIQAMEMNSTFIEAYDFEFYDVAWVVDQTIAYRNYMPCHFFHYIDDTGGPGNALFDLEGGGNLPLHLLRNPSQLCYLKLITLHWFHHVTTLLMSWIGFEYFDALGRIFVINTFVHSLMYSYYALKALKVKIPKTFAKALTTIQITQMFMIIYINLASVYFMALGRPCKRSANMVYLSGIIIPIFAYLFIQFFREAYMRRSAPKRKPE
ncbi:unnamed protein product [Allacma fusca]|uniref:Elongation of very long chain fatty acids protein n=1 Tax=Allacma fusca TaxID=39272 RepID=A0A8J2LCZ8_9HEXA|nr:unnamed protein product [Allacma fusca]